MYELNLLACDRMSAVDDAALKVLRMAAEVAGTTLETVVSEAGLSAIETEADVWPVARRLAAVASEGAS